MLVILSKAGIQASITVPKMIVHLMQVEKIHQVDALVSVVG
jgi:hypothetical protein